MRENIRQDVNGSSDKPYPQERNFVMDANPEDGIDGSVTRPSETAPDISLGQAKYAKRAGAVSIYKDATRNTADDNAASRKTESSPAGCEYSDQENEESQGI